MREDFALIIILCNNDNNNSRGSRARKFNNNKMCGFRSKRYLCLN